MNKGIYTKINREAVLVNNTPQDCLIGEISYLENDCGHIIRKEISITIIIIKNDMQKAKEKMEERMQPYIFMHNETINNVKLTEKQKEDKVLKYSLKGTKPMSELVRCVENENEDDYNE